MSASVRLSLRNLGLAAWLVGAAAVSLWVTPPRSFWSPECLGYVLPTAGMVVLAFVRREPRSEDNAWWVYLVCGWSVVYPYAYRPVEGADPRLASAILVGRLAVLLLADLTLLSLGRSFGILPAVRVVRSRGPYALVRHPVYALYLLADAALLSLQFSAWNLAVAVSGAATFVVRATREERLLMADPDYRAYAARVRWRFLPGVH